MEPTSPEEAQQDFLNRNEAQMKKNTWENYKYATNAFVNWTKEAGLTNLNTLTGRRFEEFISWRSEQVNATTLRNQLWLMKNFIEFCESIEAVPFGLSYKVEVLIPAKNAEEDVNDDHITAEEAEAILSYLHRWEYASLRHVTFLILWRTGMRISSLNALDKDDFLWSGNDNERAILQIRHRPSTGTPLKRDTEGERNVPLPPEDAQVLQDYLDHNHPGKVHHRRPLPSPSDERLLRVPEGRPCLHRGRRGASRRRRARQV